MASVVVCPHCQRKNRVPTAVPGHLRCAQCHQDVPWLVDVGDADFSAAVERSSLPVLVDVWAPWCGPCRMVGPIVERLARERAGRLKVAKVNADEAPGVSARHRISSIPTLMLYAGGHEVARTVGALPAPRLQRWLDDALEQVGSGTAPAG